MGCDVNCVQRWLSLAAFGMVVVVSFGASAQAEGQEQGCFPACRQGYVCHEGACVSACNPACEPGLTCTGQGQCVPTQVPYYVAPAPPQQPVYVDPYTARQQRRQARLDAREAVREQRLAQREKNRAELREHAYTGRVYAAAHITLQGRGVADGDTSEFGDFSQKHAVGSQLGFDLGYEFRSSMVFGLGPGLRYQRVTFQDTDVLDLTINPTFHVSFEMIELVFPISAGLSLVWDDHIEAGDGPFGTDGAGLTFGVMPGVIFWPVRGFGLYVNFGLTGHLLAVGYTNRFYTTALNTGITFAF